MSKRKVARHSELVSESVKLDKEILKYIQDDARRVIFKLSDFFL